ncbi:hypothetical protein D6C91_06977 [Aureobasidium pullulans]|uniref:Uncharacterized protein n=1 Tax=Aureobasidium pullulans TaxID=5580 RepID=A0A4S9STP0_AURPU|nr:hypothetical protein D6C91_06977 [Aureobasidium pullulans]
MAIILKGSKSNKHNIIGVCLSGLQSVVEQVQRLAPSGHFAKTINISEYPEDSGEMIFFADTDGIAQINTKELEVVDPKMPEDKIASDFEMNTFDIEILLYTLGIPFVSIKSLTYQTAKQREDVATKFNTEEACKVLVR